MNTNTAEVTKLQQLKLAQKEAARGIAQGLRATSKLIDLADRIDERLKRYERQSSPA